MVSADESIKGRRQPPEIMGAELPAWNWTRGVDALSRLLCLAVLLAVLITGAYLSIQVFQRVGKLLIHPDELKTSVESVAQLIHADAIVVPAGEGRPDVEFGRAAALAMLGGGYTIWAWIALQLVAVSGRCILAMTSAKHKPDSSTT